MYCSHGTTDLTLPPGPPSKNTRLHTQQLAGELFMMPSLVGGATSEGGGTYAEGRPVSKHSSKGTRTTGTRQREEEMYGGADMMQQEW
jgi:hypothetical protein